MLTGITSLKIWIFINIFVTTSNHFNPPLVHTLKQVTLAFTPQTFIFKTCLSIILLETRVFQVISSFTYISYIDTALS